MARLAWLGATLLAAAAAAGSAATLAVEEQQRTYPNEIVYAPGHTVTEKVPTLALRKHSPDRVEIPVVREMGGGDAC